MAFHRALEILRVSPTYANYTGPQVVLIVKSVWLGILDFANKEGILEYLNA